MKEDDIPSPSELDSEGGGGKKTEGDRLNITADESDDTTELSTAVATFINRRNSAVTVSIDWAYGGTSNATLQRRGSKWRIHCRTSSPYDVYCWNTRGPCNPNGSLKCIGGRTYYVG